MIKLQNITKQYEHTTLNNISLNFEYGKIYVIKGVSGCGKTTLLNILGLIDKDFSGQYIWKDNFLKTDKEISRDKIGYMFQNSLLISDMTIKDNLLLIKNDITLIHNYLKKLGLDKLINKYPYELSGGERSRVSVIRALLNNPTLILADEPSASLDYNNSKKIAETFSKISADNNIIVISTHEDCFDNIADEIIYLDYGSIANIEIMHRNKFENHLIHPSETNSCRKFSKYILRKIKLTNFGRNILLTLILFLIFMGIGLQQNIQNILINSVYKNYPITTFTISQFDYEEYKNKYDIKIFENYQFKQDDFTCFILTDEKYSGFGCPGVLSYGKFPSELNEIIVNQKFINQHFNVINYKECIGEEIVINDNSFIISGILNDLKDTDLYSLVYYFDYYQSSENIPAVFIPYNNIKDFGTVEPSYMLMAAYDNLYNTSAYKELRESFGGFISPWDSELLNIQSIIDSIVMVSLLAIIIMILLSMIFVANEVKLDLYFRKREFGYLQIFGITKKEIKKIVFFEKLLQIFISLSCAIILFIIAEIIIKLIWRFSLLFNPIYIILICLIIFFYVVVITYFPTNKFLKTNIIDLIKN